ncbi:MAG: c-type cytochrome biogenesis protein CcsB [Candidatus Schekmanbacteria bacterium]|nr:MAG: c-type cytochrome biogenesis protein CcsB [Candidatus Schekmanbacteria bacterium]
MLSSKLFGVVMIDYVVCSLTYIFYLPTRKEMVGKVASILTLIGLTIQTFALGLRWQESYEMGHGRIPLTNLFESMVVLSWLIVVVYVVTELKFKQKVFGAFVIPFALIALAYTSFLSDEIEPLVPALQSYWLHAHVATCMLGYASFAVACGVSIVYLIKERGERTGKSKDKGFLSIFPDIRVLDEINYKIVAIGFPFLTIGIITGAYWAHYAWGTYWSWDPKETWSLITWFIYAAFLHSRFTYGWMGRRSAILSVAGFVSVLFCYLGVNLLLSGLHSYA